MRRLPLLLIAAALCAALSAGDDGADQTKTASPALPPVDQAPWRVVVAAPSPRRTLGSARAGSLEGIRAVALRDGVGRLVVGGREVSVRPGDALGSDVVTSVDPGRVVLRRPATADPAAGEATVVITFDALGRARVRVYSTKDPTAVEPRAR